jgi:hypothetical protein
MTGLGRIRIQNKKGSKPWSGVTVGQGVEKSAVACAATLALDKEIPITALNAKDAVADPTLAMFAICMSPCEFATISRQPAR